MTEDIFADSLRDKIAQSLLPHKVERKQSLLYELSVNDRGELSKGIDLDTGKPISGGGHGFEQDILVFDQAAEGGHTSVVPLIVVEVKFGGVTTHDVIVYAEKSGPHPPCLSISALRLCSRRNITYPRQGASLRTTVRLHSRT